MMEPLVSLRLRDQGKVFSPGEELECEYQIDAVGEDDIVALEESILWYTEGKGDEDLAVHYFHRRVRGDEEGNLREFRKFRVNLPLSPLSYAGVIVKIHWCVRIRVFLQGAKEVFFEQPFQLGDVPAGDFFLRQAEEEASSDVVSEN